ncbi:hypothetical protein GCK32_017880, partial [Trichostrongylus colubriformis]
MSQLSHRVAPGQTNGTPPYVNIYCHEPEPNNESETFSFFFKVNGCQLTSVYDLRECEEGSSDLYDDEWAFRRPRSNSSDFLILRKTSRPLSVDVVGLVDSQSDPYRQYMRVVDCYELSPQSGNVIVLDKSIK